MPNITTNHTITYTNYQVKRRKILLHPGSYQKGVLTTRSLVGKLTLYGVSLRERAQTLRTTTHF